MSKKQSDEYYESMRKSMDKPDMSQIIFLIDSELKQQAFDILEREGLTMTFICQKAVKDFVGREQAIEEAERKDKKGAD